MSAIYLIEIDGDKRLVQAGSKSVAVNHIVKDALKARSVTASEVVDLMKAGIEVEEAGKPPEATTAQPAPIAEVPETKAHIPGPHDEVKPGEQPEEAVEPQTEAA